MARTPQTLPDFSFESALIAAGSRHVAGTDEAGAGPLAGSVVAAAVILDGNRIPAGLNDSKKLSAKARERLFDEVVSMAVAIGVASVSAREIDRTDIRKARLEAMRRAVAALCVQPCHILVDGNASPPRLLAPHTCLVKGDARSSSIAAAAIVAKVLRDRMMTEADRHYPGYGFSKHSGYGTADHLRAIEELGPTPLHRMTFRPLRKEA